MRIRLAVPDELDDQDRKAALDAALESVTRTVAGMVRAGAAPPAAGHIKSGAVRWQPEPPGDEHFDLPATIIQRGWGDCDDLAPWHAGSLRAAGIDPGARAVVKKSGPKRWHALVRRSDGSIEDPSLHAGMHSVSGSFPNSLVGAYAPIQPPMSADGRLCLAICPSRDPRHPNVWFARCDVPDRLEPWDWCTASAHRNPKKSILQAIQTMRRVAGDEIDDDDDARLAAVNDLVMGADPEDVADALDGQMGDEFDVDGCMEDAVNSVGFFGDILKAAVSPLTSVAKFVKNPSLKSAAGIFTDPITSHFQAAKGVVQNPMVSQALKMGIPIAATAFGGPAGAALSPFLTSLIPGGGGGGGRPAVPTGFPGFGGGGGGGGGGFDLSRIMQMFGGGMPFRISGADYEAGQIVRPWGPYGPAVMRF